MDKFIETQNLPKLNYEVENLNRYIYLEKKLKRKENQNLPIIIIKNSSVPDGFTAYQTLKI